MNIGVGSTAWIRVSRTVAGERKPSTSSRGKECCGPSDSTTASSLAAACSSKSKVRQKRLRSARPRPRLTLAPRGEWTTSCMPPVSSKKRSTTKRSVVGSAPSSAQAGGEVGDDLLGDRRGRPRPAPRRARRRLARSRRGSAGAPSGVAPRARERSPRRPAAGRRRPRTSSAVRAGASPSQNGTRRRRALGVDDPDRARLDPADPPRGAAEEEDVTGHRLDRPVLVDGADERLLRLEHDPEVGDVGDRPARGHRREAGAAPRAGARRSPGRGAGAPRAGPAR